MIEHRSAQNYTHTLINLLLQLYINTLYTITYIYKTLYNTCINNRNTYFIIKISNSSNKFQNILYPFPLSIRIQISIRNLRY